MSEFSDRYERQIELQFHQYCVETLENEACNIRKKRARKAAREKSLEELTVKELLEVSVSGAISNPTLFPVGEAVVAIEDENLAEALEHLSEQDRMMILKYFFMKMSDREIADFYHMIRRTVTHQRNKILKQLKQDMLETEE